MTSLPTGQTTPEPLSRRKQALFAAMIAAGVLLALLAWQLSRGPAPDLATDLQFVEGAFPVASLFRIDNRGAQPDAGHPAPDFAIHPPEGGNLTLADYRGRPVVINFWATWCGPCRLEMPDLVRLHETYRDQDLVILEINVAESHNAVAAFVAEFGMTMPVILDPRGDIQAAYKTQSLPATFFIDREGVIQLRWIGLITPDMLEQGVRNIL